MLEVEEHDRPILRQRRLLSRDLLERLPYPREEGDLLVGEAGDDLDGRVEDSLMKEGRGRGAASSLSEVAERDEAAAFCVFSLFSSFSVFFAFLLKKKRKRGGVGMLL